MVYFKSRVNDLADLRDFHALFVLNIVYTVAAANLYLLLPFVTDNHNAEDYVGITFMYCFPCFFLVFFFLETFSYVSQSFCISQFMFYTSWRKTNRSSCFAFLLKFHIDKRDGFANVSKPNLVLQPHVLEKDKSVQLFRFPIEISQNFTSWFCRLLFGKLISNSRKNVSLHFETPRNRSKYGI